jgi:glycosyltransferase involved in cell wall biosynthesis
MFCSTVIPTIGRPELSRAVCSVLEQNFTADDFEVIVVNDSGRPLPREDWQQSNRVQVIHTNRRERCVARNTGAAIAQGKYLHFLDDDDYLLPGALENFWTLARDTNAVWLYGASQLIDRRGQHLIQLHHGMNGNSFIQIMAGEWIPLQSSLIDSRKFFSVGGFNLFIPGAEDIDLSRRIALHGNFTGMPEVVVCIGMGVENSSTDYVRALNDARWAREKILNEPHVFARMRASANSSDWHGRILRVYLTSVVWNLQRMNVFIAVSRAIFGLASLFLAGYRIFSPGFWHAVVKKYESQTFLRGFQEANRPVERRELHKTSKVQTT